MNYAVKCKNLAERSLTVDILCSLGYELKCWGKNEFPNMLFVFIEQDGTINARVNNPPYKDLNDVSFSEFILNVGKFFDPNKRLSFSINDISVHIDSGGSLTICGQDNIVGLTIEEYRSIRDFVDNNINENS